MTDAATDPRDALFERIVTDKHVDPRPLYQEMREISPVYKTPYGLWWVLDYEPAKEVLTNKAAWTVDAAYSHAGTVPHGDRYAMQVWERTIIVTDGDNHTRLRDIVKELFKPGAIRSMNDVMEETVAAQFAELGERTEFDLRWDFAELLPTRIILDVLGIGDEHVHLFGQVAESLAQITEPTVTDATLDWADGVWRSASDIVLATAADRRANPKDDLMTRLVQAETDGMSLTPDELVAMVMVIAVAGQETTGQMICSGLYHLLEHPEQLKALREDRGLMARAIEEALRYDTATRMAGPRYPIQDTELGGQKIAAGEMVMVCLSAVNADPKVFDDPWTFDITRPPSRHAGFGIGHHHCLGSALARQEIGIVWNRLLDRYDEISSEPDLPWKPRFMVRGLESMPLSVKPSRTLSPV